MHNFKNIFLQYVFVICLGSAEFSFGIFVEIMVHLDVIEINKNFPPDSLPLSPPLLSYIYDSSAVNFTMAFTYVARKNFTPRNNKKVPRGKIFTWQL